MRLWIVRYQEIERNITVYFHLFLKVSIYPLLGCGEKKKNLLGSFYPSVSFWRGSYWSTIILQKEVLIWKWVLKLLSIRNIAKNKKYIIKHHLGYQNIHISSFTIRKLNQIYLRTYSFLYCRHFWYLCYVTFKFKTAWRQWMGRLGRDSYVRKFMKHCKWHIASEQMWTLTLHHIWMCFVGLSA